MVHINHIDIERSCGGLGDITVLSGQIREQPDTPRLRERHARCEHQDERQYQ
jgi:hypothetical protein